MESYSFECQGSRICTWQATTVKGRQVAEGNLASGLLDFPKIKLIHTNSE